MHGMPQTICRMAQGIKRQPVTALLQPKQFLSNKGLGQARVAFQHNGNRWRAHVRLRQTAACYRKDNRTIARSLGINTRQDAPRDLGLTARRSNAGTHGTLRQNPIHKTIDVA